MLLPDPGFLGFPRIEIKRDHPQPVQTKKVYLSLCTKKRCKGKGSRLLPQQRLKKIRRGLAGKVMSKYVEVGFLGACAV